jgi:glucosamine 6-phosphate synthetase-like amidotransferase/phosphosugar isomerase protein
MAVQPPPMRTGHPYYMYDSIQHQPDDIARVLKEEATTIHSLAQTIHESQDVHIVGIGMFHYKFHSLLSHHKGGGEKVWMNYCC